MNEIRLEPSWKRYLEPEFKKPYMIQLRKFLVQEIQKKKAIYPPPDEWFKALELTPFDKVQVVLVGQDPYHGPRQAHGLCFSVLPDVPFPPSLKNIFTELKKDLNIKYPKNGVLTPWAQQGVLLLNSVLTVRKGQPGSHQNQGWEKFTDRVLSILNDEKENLVFMLWGSYALMKGKFLDSQKHLILKAPHPSPLSAHRGFLGSKHFSKANKYLRSKNKKDIDWSLLNV